MSRLVLLFVLLAAACTGSELGDPPPMPSPDRDGGIAAHDGGTVDAGPPPLAEATPPEPYAVETWTYAVIASGDPDPIQEPLATGRFTTPEPGVDDDGVRWSTVILAGTTLETSNAARGVRYYCTRILAHEPFGLIARLDGSATISMNGAPLSGDFYRRGGLRLPLPVETGLNDLCVRYDSTRGAPELELWKTSHELFFNDADVTAPHLLTGDTSTQWVGLPVLNLTNTPALDVTARIVENDWFEATALKRVAIAAGAATQLAFELRPKRAANTPEETVEVDLRVESPSLDFSYATTLSLETLTATATHRRTRISQVDGSVQYYGVVPPRDFDPDRAYGLLLALHGASVEALGHARAYSKKDWAYVIAPTNRRPFGFDWEDWGRLDAIEALDDAIASYTIDPERIYLTGHSMGGHGTWNVGVNHPDRFAVLGPSAGWSQFDNYGGARSPQGPGLPEAFRAAQQHSQTLDLMDNVARHGVYIIHGSADDNVPVSEGRRMRDAALAVTDDVEYHEEPGAGHWWNGDAAEGADCVDWPPLMDFMRARTRDPDPLVFSFTTPGPWVNGRYGFASVLAVADPYAAATITSTRAGDAALEITTTNVRALSLDGDRLDARGIATVTVDGARRDVEPGPMLFGEATKRPGAHGPLKEAFFDDFLFVYPDASDFYRRFAAYLVSIWQLIGNGHAPAVPVSALTAELRASHRIVYLGVHEDALADTSRLPFHWDDGGVTLGEERYDDSAIVAVFPENGRLSAIMFAPPGEEILLNGRIPFGSGFGYPDYFVLERRGAHTAGFFDADWAYDASLSR